MQQTSDNHHTGEFSEESIKSQIDWKKINQQQFATVSQTIKHF